MNKPSINKKNSFKKEMRNSVPLIVIASVMALIGFLYTKKLTAPLISFVMVFALLRVYMYTRTKLAISDKIKKMENVFPDFIQLVASNLRAGMTVERALILSSRKDFAPLDVEILKLGKNILTGQMVEEALLTMGREINSEKIKKTINLIMTGLRSGGNLSVLLEETSRNMRERSFVEKRAASNVLMYVIFIVFGISVGAPVLFSLSSVLVGVLSGLLSDIPELQSSAQNAQLPFSITSINISPTFITYYALFFLMVSTFLASMVVGLVSKGSEKEGIKYSLPMIITGAIIFVIIKFVLAKYFASFF